MVNFLKLLLRKRIRYFLCSLSSPNVCSNCSTKTVRAVSPSPSLWRASNCTAVKVPKIKCASSSKCTTSTVCFCFRLSGAALESQLSIKYVLQATDWFASVSWRASYRPAWRRVAWSSATSTSMILPMHCTRTLIRSDPTESLSSS